jgi:catechol 2,3-dioxygenase-like lactoylglutathione lyase family enzyme
MPKPKLQHVTLSVDDPFKTAQFFKEASGMEQVGETDSPVA